MKEEIKRIIEELKDNIPIEECRSEGTSDGLTHYEEDKDSWQYKLFDYITNLQQENERLTRSVVSYDETLLKRNNEYEDYKSRCEKALKKLKEIRQSTFSKYNSNEWNNCLSYNDDIKPLENILNGSDENE
ncbi:MAG: hypothetical protein J6T23_02590 [Elusimicrobia bacterium]|nr:hypothetical protein [Elusimicrobiota bacterium]